MPGSRSPPRRPLKRAGVMVAEYVQAGLSQDPPRLFDVLRGRPARTDRCGGCRPHRAALRADRSGVAARGWGAPGLRHRHRSAGAGRRPGDAARACGHDACRRARDPRAHTRRHSPSAAVASAWERVIGLVVQPGVEFGHDRVIDYRPEKARALSGCIEGLPRLVFEAHSTDYQTPDVTRRARARSLRDPQGGAGGHLRAARGRVGAR